MRAGDLEKAVDFLARAVMADDSDAEAKALLGVAYSQKGLHTQATRALRTAVELQPHNPNFRFNLGVALERAGDMQGAALAYRDTLQLNKDHAQARAKLQAMGPQAHALIASAARPPDPGGVTAVGTPSAPLAGSMPPPGAMPPGAAPPPAPPQYGPPGASPGVGASPGYSAPPPSGPPMGGPPMGAPSALGGGLAGPQGPPGTVQCSRCGQWTKPGMSCEFCSAPLAAPRQTASSPTRAPAMATAPQYSRAALDMPGVVNVLRILIMLGIVFMGLGVVGSIVVLVAASGRSNGGANAAVMMVTLPVLLVFLLLYVWLYKALGDGSPGAWWVVQVLQILNLINFPVGTVIGGIILYFWNQPDTKDWFGL